MLTKYLTRQEKDLLNHSLKKKKKVFFLGEFEGSFPLVGRNHTLLTNHDPNIVLYISFRYLFKNISCV